MTSSDQGLSFPEERAWVRGWRFLYPIRVLSFWIKRGYGLEWLEKHFLYHIRVLSFWIKRGYDLEWLEKRFLYHIRVLSFWIKRGYDLENTFHKNLWYPSVRPPLIRPSVRPSATHPSVRPPLIRPSVSAFYPNPISRIESAKVRKSELIISLSIIENIVVNPSLASLITVGTRFKILLLTSY